MRTTSSWLITVVCTSSSTGGTMLEYIEVERMISKQEKLAAVTLTTKSVRSTALLFLNAERNFSN